MPNSVPTITRKATKAIDIEKEIKAFVESVVQNDPQTKAQYQRMLINEESGTRLETEPWHAMKWLTPNVFRDRFRKSIDEEDLYLVQQQLIAHNSDGFSIDKNIVAQVRAIDHRVFPGELDLPPNHDELTLKFEGFVDVELSKVKGSN